MNVLSKLFDACKLGWVLQGFCQTESMLQMAFVVHDAGVEDMPQAHLS